MGLRAREACRRLKEVRDERGSWGRVEGLEGGPEAQRKVGRLRKRAEGSGIQYQRQVRRIRSPYESFRMSSWLRVFRRLRKRKAELGNIC